jgi:NADH dehydrogenase
MHASGHRVRLVLPTAPDVLPEWPAQVEPWTAAAADSSGLLDAARDCETAILIDRDVTPEVGGDQAEDDGYAAAVLQAVAGAKVRRLIQVSALAELRDTDEPGPPELARGFPGEWLHVRAAPIYGVGNDPITLFLIMMRSLPAVPILSATHVLQPLWHDDLARALVGSVGLPSAAVNRVLEIAGPDTVTHEQLYERIGTLIDRRPLRLPVPDFLAAHGTRLAQALRRSLPLEASHLTFARASTVDVPAADNALSTVFRVAPTRLDDGLVRLANELRELTPSEGIGSIEVKRFSADIRGSRQDAAELLRTFRRHFKDVMPIDVGVEPASPQAELDPGAVVTMTLPGRGHVQVRVEEVAEHHVVVSTLQGHALAGFVRFSARPHEGATRFEVMTCDTAANALDWVALTLGGARVQDANWTRVVQNVVDLSGGHAEEVRSDERKLEADEAHNVQQWIRGIIQRERAAEDAGPGRGLR